MNHNPNLSKWQQERTSAEIFFRRHHELETKLFVRSDMSGSKRTTTLRNLMTGEFDFGLPSAFMSAADQLEHTAFGDLLKAAERENSPEATKELLKMLLISLGDVLLKAIGAVTRRPPGPLAGGLPEISVGRRQRCNGCGGGFRGENLMKRS